MKIFPICKGAYKYFKYIYTVKIAFSNKCKFCVSLNKGYNYTIANHVNNLFVGIIY